MSPIRAVSFTPDGRQLVVASGSLGYLLDGKTLAPKQVFPLHAIHPAFQWKSNSVFRVIESGSIETYDLSTGKQVMSIRPANSYGSISLSSNGLVGVEGDGQIGLYDLSSGIRQKTFAIADEFSSDIDLNSDGTRLLSTEFKHAWLYDVPAGRLLKLLDLDENRPKYAAFGGDFLAVASTYIVDQRLDIFNAQTGENVSRFPINSVSGDISFSPNNRFLSAPGYETFSVYDVERQKAVMSFDSPTSGRYNSAFSPDSKTVVFGNRLGQLFVADLELGRVTRKLAGLPGNTVNCFALSPNGKSLLTCGSDQVAKQFEIASGATQRTLGPHLGEVESATFMADGQVMTASENYLYLWKGGGLVRKSLAVGSFPDELVGQKAGPYYAYTSYGDEDANVVIEDSRTGKVAARTTVPGTSAEALQFSSDGARLAILSDTGLVSLWDWQSGKKVATAQAEEYSSSLAFSPSGKYLAVQAAEGGVNLLDAKSLKRVKFIRQPKVVTLAFAAQTDHVIVSTAKVLTVYDAQSGKQITRFDSPYTGEFQVLSDGTGVIFDSGPDDKPVVASLLKAPNGAPVFR